eukprot:10471019-Heterocapsa_arctica.AAC.1
MLMNTAGRDVPAAASPSWFAPWWEGALDAPRPPADPTPLVAVSHADDLQLTGANADVQAWLARTQLPDGRRGLLVDIGAYGNLSGD